MRRQLKRVLARLARVRYLGRLVLIGRSVWRGPVESDRLARAQLDIQGLAVALDELRRGGGTDRPAALGLDRLFEVVTEVSAVQARIAADRDDLAKSVPVALRALQRDASTLLRRVEEVETRVEVQTGADALDDEVAALARRADEQAQLLGSLVATGQDHASTLGYLLKRVELVRSELMFEMRYGGGARAEAREIEPVAKIDLPSLAGPLRVNVGCGHLPLEGYVNVDSRDLPGVDVVADVTRLPFEPGTVSEVYSAHFLEHFPQEELTRRILPALVATLAPGGVFRAVVPDVDAMMRAYVSGNYPYADLREVVYGGQDYDGDFHYNMFTPESLTALLEGAGLTAVSTIERARVNGRSLEFEIEARRA